MCLAEHEGERKNEQFVIEIVADMHDPVAPVFSALFHDERADEASRAVARLGEVAHTASPDRSIRTPRELEQWK